MKKGIIYEWRNKLDGKFYVGQTIRPKRRYETHVKAKGDSLFHRAIRKHGIENFEYSVVATYEHETSEGLYDLLNEAEKERIKFRNSLAPNGYNVADGGNSGSKISGFTQERYDEYCENCRNAQYKRWSKQEERKKQSYTQKKRFEDENEREKDRKAQIERYKNPKNRENVGIGVKRHHQEHPETREKQRIATTERFKDPEVRKRQREIQTIAQNNPETKEKNRQSQLKRYNGENGEFEREKTGIAMKKAYKEHPEYHEINRQAQIKSFQENPERREKTRIVSKRNWENDEIRNKIITAINKAYEDPELRKKCGDSTRGKKFVNNGIDRQCIDVESVDEFLATHPDYIVAKKMKQIS